ncbi:MAG: hypothetical protein ACRCYY_08480 [Trueperaceae bacterium]
MILSREPNVTFRPVKYDVKKLEGAAKRSAMPHFGQWLAGNKYFPVAYGHV